MKSLPLMALACGTIALGGCDSTTSGTITALEGRVAGLERRLARPTTAGSPQGEGRTTTEAVVERLDADLRSLERRLAAVEAEVGVLRDAVAAGNFDEAGGGEARRDRRSERRLRMRTLTATYRDKLAEVRQQYRDDPGDPGRQRALRDVVEWYRRERRAAMRGD